MPFAELRDQRFYYEDTGGTGPAVVFNHGFLMDHEMFAPQVAALRDRYRVFTWDMRFHGQTHSSTTPYTIWHTVDDLAALLHHVGITEAAVCGFSFGGWIATRFALSRPQRTRALVLMDTYERMEDPATRAAYRKFKDTVLERGFDDEIVDTFRNLLFHPDYDCDRWIAKWRGRSPLSWGWGYDAMFGRDDVNDALFAITCPSIVLHGEHNLANGPEVSQELADRLGTCDGLVIVEHAAHTSNLEQPDRVNRVLLDFLDRHLAR